MRKGSPSTKFGFFIWENSFRCAVQGQARFLFSPRSYVEIYNMKRFLSALALVLLTGTAFANNGNHNGVQLNGNLAGGVVFSQSGAGSFATGEVVNGTGKVSNLTSNDTAGLASVGYTGGAHGVSVTTEASTISANLSKGKQSGDGHGATGGAAGSVSGATAGGIGGALQLNGFGGFGGL